MYIFIFKPHPIESEFTGSVVVVATTLPHAQTLCDEHTEGWSWYPTLWVQHQIHNTDPRSFNVVLVEKLPVVRPEYGVILCECGIQPVD